MLNTEQMRFGIFHAVGEVMDEDLVFFVSARTTKADVPGPSVVWYAT